ncbi:M48 family metalloprotease [Micromonospora sp. NIE79]|uniref:M48 family metalloprotease n=1 Tax=Micromonospora trifolii TaxID=2911208 RepID=A0ABS9N320_9ACTN|nr:M48 family metalloprotease [Micromonospora trifolii]MCG5444055.1 M48 family metalloprotease [Micromonospora trifolii]
MTTILDPPQRRHDDTERVLAAPSGTHLRFLLLITAALATSAVILAIVYLAIPPHSQSHRTVLEQCGPVLRGPAGSAPTTLVDNLARDEATVDAFVDCTAPATLAQATWVGWALTAQVGLVLLVYGLHPWWIRRRGRLERLDADADPVLRDELADLLDRFPLRRRPQWLLAPYSYGQSGQAYGLPWSPRIRLDVGLRVLLATDRPRFRAVVLHELAHLRNRDVGITYLTIAVWWVFVGTALPLLLLSLLAPVLPLTMIGAGLNSGWQLAAVLGSVALLTAMVYLARNSVLRTREHYADVAAAAAGSRSAVLAAIDVLPLRPRHRLLWHGTHPAPGLRRAAVVDPLLLLRTGATDVVVFGLAVGLALTNLLYSVPAAVGATVGSVLVCALVAAALALFLAACARRAVARAHSAVPTIGHYWGVPALLGLSVSAGSAVSALSAFTGGEGMAGADGSFAAAALLCLGACLLHVWFTSAHRASWRPDRATLSTQVLTVLFVLIGAVFLFFWLVGSEQLTAVRLGPAPTYGSDIAWYRDLARVISTTYLPVVSLSNLPLGLALVALACAPLLAARVALGWLRPTLVTGIVAGAGALLVAVALPFAAQWSLPDAVRHPTEDFHLGGSASFTLVLIYSYGLATAAAVLLATATVAFRSERMRPALVTLAALVTVTTAAPGLYLLKTEARCLDIYADGLTCGVSGAPIEDHTLYLDTVLAWAGIVAVPVVLIAAGAGAVWRARRPRRPAPDEAAPPADGPSTAGARARRLVAVLAVLIVGAVFAVTELPRLKVLLLPAETDGATSAAVDGCLPGYWVERSRRQLQAISTTDAAIFASSGAVWSFTRQGTATLHLGDSTARSETAPQEHIAYLSAGIIRWRFTATNGQLTFAADSVSATLTGSVGGARRGTITLGTDNVDDYALPAAYSCTGDTLTAAAPGHVVTLHRIGLTD